jgi:hypothetical protein
LIKQRVDGSEKVYVIFREAFRGLQMLAPQVLDKLIGPGNQIANGEISLVWPKKGGTEKDASVRKLEVRKYLDKTYVSLCQYTGQTLDLWRTINLTVDEFQEMCDLFQTLNKELVGDGEAVETHVVQPKPVDVTHMEQPRPVDVTHVRQPKTGDSLFQRRVGASAAPLRLDIGGASLDTQEKVVGAEEVKGHETLTLLEKLYMYLLISTNLSKGVVVGQNDEVFQLEYQVDGLELCQTFQHVCKYLGYIAPPLLLSMADSTVHFCRRVRPAGYVFSEKEKEMFDYSILNVSKG